MNDEALEPYDARTERVLALIGRCLTEEEEYRIRFSERLMRWEVHDLVTGIVWAQRFPTVDDARIALATYWCYLMFATPGT